MNIIQHPQIQNKNHASNKGKRLGVPNWHPVMMNRVKHFKFQNNETFYSAISINLKLV